MPGAVKKIKCLSHVGHVYPQAKLARALLEPWPGRMLPVQASTRERIHCLAQPDMPLALKHLGRRRDIVVQPDGCPHADSLASAMH
jgi:hypothetical protein